MKLKTKKQRREFNEIIDLKISMYKEFAESLRNIDKTIIDVRENVKGLSVDLENTEIKSNYYPSDFHPVFGPIPRRVPFRNEMPGLSFSQKYLINEGMIKPLAITYDKIHNIRNKIIDVIIPELMRMKIDI